MASCVEANELQDRRGKAIPSGLRLLAREACAELHTLGTVEKLSPVHPIPQHGHLMVSGCHCAPNVLCLFWMQVKLVPFTGLVRSKVHRRVSYVAVSGPRSSVILTPLLGSLMGLVTLVGKSFMSVPLWLTLGK